MVVFAHQSSPGRSISRPQSLYVIGDANIMQLNVLCEAVMLLCCYVSSLEVVGEEHGSPRVLKLRRPEVSVLTSYP